MDTAIPDDEDEGGDQPHDWGFGWLMGGQPSGRPREPRQPVSSPLKVPREAEALRATVVADFRRANQLPLPVVACALRVACNPVADAPFAAPNLTTQQYVHLEPYGSCDAPEEPDPKAKVLRVALKAWIKRGLLTPGAFDSVRLDNKGKGKDSNKLVQGAIDALPLIASGADPSARSLAGRMAQLLLQDTPAAVLGCSVSGDWPAAAKAAFGLLDEAREGKGTVTRRLQGAAVQYTASLRNAGRLTEAEVGVDPEVAQKYLARPHFLVVAMHGIIDAKHALASEALRFTEAAALRAGRESLPLPSRGGSRPPWSDVQIAAVRAALANSQPELLVMHVMHVVHAALVVGGQRNDSRRVEPWITPLRRLVIEFARRCPTLENLGQELSGVAEDVWAWTARDLQQKSRPFAGAEVPAQFNPLEDRWFPGDDELTEMLAHLEPGSVASPRLRQAHQLGLHVADAIMLPWLQLAREGDELLPPAMLEYLKSKTRSSFQKGKDTRPPPAGREHERLRLHAWLRIRNESEFDAYRSAMAEAERLIRQQAIK